MTHIPKIKKKKVTACESDQLLDLTHKDFRRAIVNMFKKLKKITN